MTALPAPSAPTIHARPIPLLRVGGLRRVAGSIGIVLFGWTLALYALTFLVVRQHYLEYPPHYDSIGLFADLFQLLNWVPIYGVPFLLPHAFSTGLSWLQPAYALALSWAPIKAPERLVSLNFVLLLAAQAAILAYGRTYRFGRLRQVLAATLPIVPGALYAWDGGIQDLRRDVQLVLLALAILFTSLAYVTAPELAARRRPRGPGRPRAVVPRQRGIGHPDRVGAGDRGGHNQEPRDGGIAALVRLAIVPVVVFLLLALPYYAVTLPSTFERYTTSVWGVGEGRVESLLAFWNMPFNVLLGGDSRLSGRVRVALVTGGLLAAALAATFVLLAHANRDRGRRAPPRAGLRAAARERRLGRRRGVALQHAPAWLRRALARRAVSADDGRHRRHNGRADRRSAPCANRRLPDRTARRRDRLRAAAGLGSCADGAESAQGRGRGRHQRTPGGHGRDRRARRERPVAFLAYDTLSRHHFRYYAALDNTPNVVEFESWPRRTVRSSISISPCAPPTTCASSSSDWTRCSDAGQTSHSVYTDTGRYADPREPLWPYQVGRPVVDAPARRSNLETGGRLHTEREGACAAGEHGGASGARAEGSHLGAAHEGPVPSRPNACGPRARSPEAQRPEARRPALPGLARNPGPRPSGLG